MTKTKKILSLLTMLVLILSFASCSKQRSLKEQIDELEMIIEKYEPQFKSTAYGTEEYTQMVTEYNKEIFDWAEEFEDNRYEKDGDSYKRNEKGEKIPVPEFIEVQSRFYELNNKMTRMVLAGIPKPEEPEESEIITKETD